jgi:hypothetical protein
MKNNIQKEVTAMFSHDSKRMHCFSVIEDAGGIRGAIYVLKGSPIPESVTIRLRTRAEAEAEREDKDERKYVKGHPL